MKPTFQFDIGTLLVAVILICLIFAFVLFILASRFRQHRGTKQIACAFLCAGAGIFVLMLRSHMPLTLNVVVANGLLMATNIVFYAGISGLLSSRPRYGLPVASAVTTLLALLYFKAFKDRTDIRIILLSINGCLIWLNPVVDLAHNRGRSVIVRMLMVFLLLCMIGDALRGIATAVLGSPADFFQYNSVQAAYVAVGIFSVCGLGILSMALVTREITSSIERSARRDALTGALNRLGIEELLAVEVERSRRTAVPLSLALLDIDHFKAFNDTGGHAAGDEVLRNVVSAISHHLRAFDSCGRIGGDEFLLLFPGSGAPDTSTICDRILREVAALPPPSAVGLSPTLSIGFTEGDLADTAASMLARADRALYSAKQQGRNCVQMELAPIRTVSPLPLARPIAKSRSGFRKATASMRRFRS